MANVDNTHLHQHYTGYLLTIIDENFAVVLW